MIDTRDVIWEGVVRGSTGVSLPMGFHDRVTAAVVAALAAAGLTITAADTNCWCPNCGREH